ncbi:hypothetical protein BGM25_04100 [Bacillus sp. FJAT-29953]|nr:hypothetical protein [Bacillus sp. FJAT-29953]
MEADMAREIPVPRIIKYAKKIQKIGQALIIDKIILKKLLISHRCCFDCHIHC